MKPFCDLRTPELDSMNGFTNVLLYTVHLCTATQYSLVKHLKIAFIPLATK